jgi:hypothetical protein
MLEFFLVLVGFGGVVLGLVGNDHEWGNVG